MLIIILGLIVVCVTLLWTYFRIKFRRMMQLADKIPGPKPLPLIGNALEFGTNTKEIFNNVIRLSNEYEAISRYWLGPQLCVHLTDPAYVEAILSNPKLLDKAWSYKYLKLWLGTGLLTGSGQKWKSHRKLITPTFHFKILETFVDAFNSNADILIKQLSTHVNGSEFDIQPYITMCALDNICETAMGESVNAQEDSDSEYVKAIKSMCDSIMFRSFRPWLHADFLFEMTSAGKLQKKCLDILHGKTKRVIASRKKRFLETAGSRNDTFEDNEGIGRHKHTAFLDLLIQSSENGTLLTDQDIQEEVNTFMFEGHDTVAASMGFTCWSLAAYQNIQEKVMSELKEIFGDSNRSPNIQDLQAMKYLEQVIKESLRLYPSVPLYGRQLTTDLSIGKYTLPAHTNVFILPYVMHRDPKYFPDPEKFDPDRFLPENILDRPPHCYVPFAAGARNCIGQKYAMLEIKVTLCQLLRNYKLLPGTTPLDITNEIVLKSTTGINIALEARGKA
ncbi:cytochrome P450 4C1-like [Zootermopsis nevadensis]|uniref:Cytochrome P450 4C1 n=1 Tax=Zootermopsis nevadensis TaxID=136037 RepID=A0A067RPH3_ZOONE|nr:cytochrome P450 4C1-like [Zootermopsis nevadensis]XP_021913449.1 cytochrome P450 4C1-like [Zootermopsis nevadensis]XP_021913450.1 cytochrome P450 4C1-like [Zootermopsis nevadensis]KDR22530.1 Cytochrome P450 4C1 [Zootermopsis nevadensis]